MNRALKRWFEWPNNNNPHNLIQFEKDFNKLKGQQTSYTLYRGMSVRDFEKRSGINRDRLAINKVVEYNTKKNTDTRSRGLRSWTTDVGTARNFAGKNGIIVKAVVSSNNVFLNTKMLQMRNNEYNVENEIIVKPSVQKAKIIKVPGETFNVRAYKLC